MIDDLIDVLTTVSTEHSPAPKQNAKRASAADDAWAMHAADMLLSMKDVAGVLGSTPDRTALIRLLLKLNSEYFSEPQSQSWEKFIAGSLMDIV